MYVCVSLRDERGRKFEGGKEPPATKRRIYGNRKKCGIMWRDKGRDEVE